ncbi:MAG: serine protease [Bdellovibrionaceae bacterium]|nr:serine protease [Pseudobdellovibrionaceae bacterium]
MKLCAFFGALALTFSLATVQAKSGKLHSKIVGGGEASHGEFPFIVSLQTNYMGHFCGGSLIKKNWVLTAAHCVSGIIDKVVIGLHDQKNMTNVESISVKKIIPHPNYDSDTTDYDFALLELAQDSRYEPIALNTAEIDIPASNSPIMATVAGWGATNESSYTLPNLLQKVDVPLIAQQSCNNDYRGSITDRMLCAGYDRGGKDSCQGDSGGPLIADADDNQRYLIGVVSWGEGCARARKPGVYSKVSAAISWINQNAL